MQCERRSADSISRVLKVRAAGNGRRPPHAARFPALSALEIALQYDRGVVLLVPRPVHEGHGSLAHQLRQAEPPLLVAGATPRGNGAGTPATWRRSCPNHFRSSGLGATSLSHRSRPAFSLLTPRGQSRSTRLAARHQAPPARMLSSTVSSNASSAAGAHRPIPGLNSLIPRPSPAHSWPHRPLRRELRLLFDAL